MARPPLTPTDMHPQQGRTEPILPPESNDVPHKLPVCMECDKPIPVGDAVWHEPFAGMTPTDNPNVSQTYGVVTANYNPNALPLHRACFKARHPEVPLPD